jgi:hypothetical protein
MLMLGRQGESRACPRIRRHDVLQSLERCQMGLWSLVAKMKLLRHSSWWFFWANLWKWSGTKRGASNGMYSVRRKYLRGCYSVLIEVDLY